MKKEIKLKNKKKSNLKWTLQIITLAFCISLVFSFASEIVLSNVNTIIGIIVLLIFILLGVVFDMIGVAVTSADEKPFHSMSAQKVHGAAMAVVFKKNADKVSSFCNDVVGDICGIISGSAGVIISSSVSKALNSDQFITTLLVTALIAALTIGGKAFGKSIAIENSTAILTEFSSFVSFFYKPKK